MQQHLILASASPQRHDLLSKLKIPFEVKPCPLEEPRLRHIGIAANRWSEALAYFKASAVAEAHPDAWVLGADTVVHCKGTILGKPRNVADARRMLLMQAGGRANVITGVALVRRTPELTRVITHATTAVWLRHDLDAIDAYLESGAWHGKAGGYGIQDCRETLVERVEGSLTNVIGLPLELVERLLKRFEVDRPDAINPSEASGVASD